MRGTGVIAQVPFGAPVSLLKVKALSSKQKGAIITHLCITLCDVFCAQYWRQAHLCALIYDISVRFPISVPPNVKLIPTLLNIQVPILSL